MPVKVKSDIIILVVDVSPAVRASTEDTFFLQSQRCVTNILQRKIFAEKCKDHVGILLFGTDDTENNLDDGQQYQNIKVFQKPRLVDWEMIAKVEHLPRGNKHADWLDAIIVALDMIHTCGEDLYDNKKVVLMTDFNMDFSDSQTNAIIDGLKSLEVDLNVIGPSMPDEEDNTQLNWNGKIKTPQQLAAEMLMQRILSAVDGMMYSFDEAIPQLIFFEKKSQTSALWNVKLTLGDSLQIPVSGRIKIKQSTPNTWKEEYGEDENAAIIIKSTYFNPTDEENPIPSEDLIRGYQYGSTVVPFGDEDQQLKYTSGAVSTELSILGFTSMSLASLELRAGEQVLAVTARDYDEDAAVALSAFMKALQRLQMVAITRRICRKGSNPVLGALFPEVTDDYECLIWIALPFEEDIRNFSFPSLQKVEERVTDDEQQLIDAFIDAMHLEPDGTTDEEFDPTHVVNPRLQYYHTCLTQRAVSPDEPLPPPGEHILNILSPRPEQLNKINSLIEDIKKSFPLEDKRKVKKIITFDENIEKDNVDQPTTITREDLVGETVTKITSLTPAKDFMALLMGPNPNFRDICKQMDMMIFKFLDISSLNNDLITTEKLLDSLKVFRKECININPTPYNDFIVRFKSAIQSCGHKQLWAIVTQDNLGLITTRDTLKSNYGLQEASDFYLLEENVESKVEMTDEDFEDMLDQL